MTILDRMRGTRRPVEIRRIAKDILNRDVAALGRDAADVRDQVADIRAAAADAIEQFQSIAAQAGERAGDAVAQVGDGATKAAKDISKAKDVRVDAIKLDKGVDDIVARLKATLPTDRISHLVENLERELPTTDKGRYDRAYSRGWARARSSFVVVGAATGIAAGILAAYLFDPKHGAQRRDSLARRARKTTKDVSRQVSRTAHLTTDRARGFAIERGLITPDGGGEDRAMQATPASLVAVMDAGPTSTWADSNAGAGSEEVSGSARDRNGEVEPVMPYADGPIVDPASTEREPMDAPAGGFIGGVPAAGADALTAADAPYAARDQGDTLLQPNANAVTSSLEPQAEDATLTGDESDRGTWHRTL